MSSAAVRAHTTADAATVYALLRDESTWPTWINLDSMIAERDGPDGPHSVGTIRLVPFRRLGIKLTTREQVVELVADRRFSYALVSGLPLADYSADVDLHPLDGGTAIGWSGSWRSEIPRDRAPHRTGNDPDLPAVPRRLGAQSRGSMSSLRTAKAGLLYAGPSRAADRSYPYHRRSNFHKSKYIYSNYSHIDPQRPDTQEMR